MPVIHRRPADVVSPPVAELSRWRSACYAARRQTSPLRKLPYGDLRSASPPISVIRTSVQTSRWTVENRQFVDTANRHVPARLRSVSSTSSSVQGMRLVDDRTIHLFVESKSMHRAERPLEEAYPRASTWRSFLEQLRSRGFTPDQRPTTYDQRQTADGQQVTGSITRTYGLCYAAGLHLLLLSSNGQRGTGGPAGD